MRPLLLRAFAWTMLTFLLVGIVARVSTDVRNQQFAREIVLTLMDMGLDERLVELEAEPASTRRALIDRFPPGLASRMTLLDRAELPTEDFTSTVIDERPVWMEPQALYVELSGQQVLRIDTALSLYIADSDPRRFVIPFILVLTTLSSIAIVFPVARRIGVLSQASSRVASGDLSVRVDDSGSDAIGELARQFDRMTAAIETQTREREAFFHSVAHELGTPLSRMALVLEMLGGAETDDARAKRIAQLEQEIDDLESLTSELLRWAAEDRERAVEEERIDVSATVRDLVDREPDEALEVTIDCADAVVVWADPEGFRRATDNVLRNARRYAKERIRIRVVESPDEVEVIIEDDGPGVAPADRIRIFEPFARVDESRDRNTGGTGLGLAIVSRILDRHGGRVRVTGSTALGGAAFVSSWPRGGSHENP
jgi:two-component system sensor histidine kinase RstB